jgi:hypothetical protein
MWTWRLGFAGTTARNGTFKRTVKIDRQLGTYNQHFEQHDDSAGSATTFDTGICQKREAF